MIRVLYGKGGEFDSWLRLLLIGSSLNGKYTTLPRDCRHFRKYMSFTSTCLVLWTSNSRVGVEASSFREAIESAIV